jgi:hypothetical protein
MAKVLIGCRLPNGLTLEIINLQVDPTTGKPLNVLQPAPRNDERRVVLNGANSVNTKILRAAAIPVYGKTLVDETLWEEWCKFNAKHPALRNGALFMAKNDAEFDAKAKVGLQVRGGFEPLDPGVEIEDDAGVIVASDKDQLRKLAQMPR